MRTRHLLIASSFATAFAAAVSLGAQTPLTGAAKWADSASREIETATAAIDLDRLKSTAAMLDRVLIATPNDPLLLYYRSLALFRSAGLYTGLKRNNDAKHALEEADILLEQIGSKAPAADALALRSAVLGQQIGLSGNPLSAMTLGPKSSDLIDRAMEVDSKNPRVWLIRGMSAMFTPKMFGGGTDKAERDLRKAAELFAVEQPVAPAPSWGHADAYIWLGQALQKDERIDEARAAYQKALEIQPENQWVQRTLLPSLGTTAKK